MFSRILIKLVDQAVVPAMLLLVVRILSVIFVSRYFGVDFTIGQSGFVFNAPEDYVLVNSYSTLTMICALSVGLLYILMKSLYLHETHITPSFTAKLFSMRLSFFIQSSFDLYSQGVVWVSYLFLLVFVSALMVIFGLIYLWVLLVSVVLAVISTYFFVVDIENEIFFEKSKKGDDVNKEYVLTFGSSNE